jgi:uncharacterized protein (TIGR03000 family)
LLSFIVEPPDAVLELDGRRMQSAGRERQVSTPPLRAGQRYTYRLVARWPDGSCCDRDLTFTAGEQLHVEVRPAAPSPAKPKVYEEPIANFGIDLSQLGTGPERFLLDGNEISRSAAEQLLQGAGLEDDSHKPHLTIVSGDAARRREIIEALAQAPELARFRDAFRVQAYAPEHWAMKRFALQGNSAFQRSGIAVIVQPPAGSDGASPARWLYRYDGPAALAQFLAGQAPLPAPPHKISEMPGWVWLALAGAVGFLLLRRGGNGSASSVLGWLNGYKTYLAAGAAALVAANQSASLFPAEWEKLLLTAAGALGLAGLRHAIARGQKPENRGQETEESKGERPA